MKDIIFLISADQRLTALENSSYVNEDMLQKYLEDYPDLLAGYQVNEINPRRWLLVKREMGIADGPNASDRWSLDHLFLDQDGIPTLIEVKRAGNTEIRRTVVGQMLDYAANSILHWSPDVVRQRFEKNCNEKNIDPTEAVAALLEIDPIDSDRIESYWDTVYDNLKSGQVRLIFVADRIPKELRRIIEFLNERMQDVEVLGVELPQYVGADLTVIVPKVIGKTTLAEQVKRTAGSRQWDEPSFFESLKNRHGDDYVNIASRILEWALGKQLRISWGKGNQDGSFIPVFDYKGVGHKLFAVWTSGLFEFYFQHYKNPFHSENQRRELMTKFNGIPSISIDPAKINQRPSVPLSSLQDSSSLEQLLLTFEWFIEEIKKAN